MTSTSRPPIAASGRRSPGGRRVCEKWSQRGGEAPVGVGDRRRRDPGRARDAPRCGLQFGNVTLRPFPADNETHIGTELATSQVGPASPRRRWSSPTSTVPGPSRPTRRRCRRSSPACRRPPASPAWTSRSSDGNRGAVDGGARAGPGGEAMLALGRGFPTRRPGLGDRQGGRDRGGWRLRPDAQSAHQISGDPGRSSCSILICGYFVLLVVLHSVILPLEGRADEPAHGGTAYGVMVMFFQSLAFGWTGSNHPARQHDRPTVAAGGVWALDGSRVFLLAASWSATTPPR